MKAERLSFNTEDKKRRFNSTRFHTAYSFRDIGVVEPMRPPSTDIEQWAVR